MMTFALLVAVIVDFGCDGIGGYPEIEVTGVTAPARIRVAYATHPDGLGDKGDFWHETRATYLGKSVFLPILPANTDRYDIFEVLSNGTYRASLAQGLVRYAKCTVEQGEAEVRTIRFINDGIHSEEPVVGSFVCSDERLNGVWRASVRTCQLAAIPGRSTPITVGGVHTNATLGPSLPYLSDGAKRDRLVWSGDLWWAQRNMYFAFAADSPYMPGSIRMLADSQLPCGYMQAAPFPEAHAPFADGDWGHFGSDEFAAWFIPVLHDHVLYTGDREMARTMLPAVGKLLGYLMRHTNSEWIFEPRKETCKNASGLVFGAKSLHHRAYMQVLLWKCFADAAKLASWAGDAMLERTWLTKAERFAEVARRRFWDAQIGGFVSSLELHEFCPEANVLAIAAHLVTEDEAASIIARHHRHHHGKFQALAVRGAFEYGCAKEALRFIADHNWYAVLSDDWRGLRTTTECMGMIRKGWGDEAHPDTAIAGALSNYILGVEPVEPGYAKFRVRPVCAGSAVTWAKGRVPTPFGFMDVEWHLSDNGKLEIAVSNPRGTERVE